MAEVRIEIVTRADEEQLAEVCHLFTEYAEWMTSFVTASTIAREIATLPAPFEPPLGRLLLARDSTGRACGTVGLRRHEDGAAEIKRLFVRPECRGTGMGFALFSAALDAACELGYTQAVVTTVPAQMQTAARMYERIGFEPTEKFERHNHANVDMRYLRYELAEWCGEDARGDSD